MNRNSILKTVSLSVLSLALLSSVPAQAQQANPPQTDTAQSDTQVLRAQIEELQKRLDAIETAQKKSAATAAAAPSSPITSKEKVVLSGLLQVQALNYSNEDSRVGGTRGIDTFRLRRGELRLTAPSITPRISGTVMFDPAKAVSGRTNIASGTNLSIRARDNALQEIEISYLLNQNAGKNTNTFVDVGQYKLPLGYEGDQVASSALTFVERALMFTQRDTQDAGYGDVRDTGIQLRGLAGGQVAYNLGLFNGLGDLQNTTSQSKQKALIGRVTFKPTSVKGLQLGISAATSNAATLTSGTNRFNRDLYNGFIAYKKNKVGVQAEYLSGRTQVRDMAGTLNNVRGYYGSLSYLFTPKLEGAFRYDYFDANRSLANSAVRDYTLGVNYYIKGNNAKIQANIVRRQGGDNAPAGIRDSRTELRTNFQVAF